MIQVRLVRREDEATWLALWGEWQDHMAGQVPGEVSARSFDMIVTEGSGLVSFLAFDAVGTGIGFATASTTPFAWTGGPVVFLQDLFVSPKGRGAGVGSALMETIYGYADEIGAGQVFWFVDETGRGLQEFYSARAIRTPYLRFMRRPWPW